jgi:hypothetical protein
MKKYWDWSCGSPDLLPANSFEVAEKRSWIVCLGHTTIM